MPKAVDKLLQFWKPILAFLVAYFLGVGLIWAFVSPISFFAQSAFQINLQDYWVIVFYVCPTVPAAIAAVIALAMEDRNPLLSEFNRRTQRALANIRERDIAPNTIIEKREIEICEDQLSLAKPVLLTGDAGTGKTGIGVVLTESALRTGVPTLLLDSRRLEDVSTEQQLAQEFGVSGSLIDEIARLGEKTAVRIVIDQLDNVVGKSIASILSEFAVDCLERRGIQIVVISRKRESFENSVLQPLLRAGFVEVECTELSIESVLQEFARLGISNPNNDLILLCRNLLNLVIVAEIAEKDRGFNLNGIKDEVTLWNAYFEVLQELESAKTSLDRAFETFDFALILARSILTSGSTEAIVDGSDGKKVRRLESWGILQKIAGRRYRFTHEKFQDYLYARFATERGYLPKQIIDELGEFRSRNAIVWVEEIYRSTNSDRHMRFLEEVLDG
jgi:hypothetical protein